MIFSGRAFPISSLLLSPSRGIHRIAERGRREKANEERTRRKMTTTASAWGKPGAWALESEEHETAEVLQQQETAAAAAAAPAVEVSADFPSLAAAAATRIPKKKKGQTISLAEFNNGGGASVNQGSGKFQVRSMTSSVSPLVQPATGLTNEERMMLPTAPRERTAEELELGNSRGFNYYGGGRSRTNGGEDSVSRWDSSRGSDEGRRNGFGGGAPGSNRDLAPSRADEVDDWGANKRSLAPSSERRERGGGFFESQSRADDHDSWVSNKSAPPPLPENRRMGDGFRERRGFDTFGRDAPNGGGVAGAESWGRRREDAGGERPRLKLQPRTLPLEKSDGEQTQVSKNSPFGAARPRDEVLPEKGNNSSNENGDPREEAKPVPKSKASNPFGAARPREEVLAEKGQDWKQIDERLESMKIREDGQSVSKKSSGIGEPGDKTERAWRKPDPVEPPATEQSGQDGEESAAAAAAAAAEE